MKGRNEEERQINMHFLCDNVQNKYLNKQIVCVCVCMCVWVGGQVGAYERSWLPHRASSGRSSWKYLPSKVGLITPTLMTKSPKCSPSSLSKDHLLNRGFNVAKISSSLMDALYSLFNL